MSLKGEVKIAVHLERFRNIELFKQGLYQLRLKVFYSHDSQVRSNQIHYAKPKSM